MTVRRPSRLQSSSSVFYALQCLQSINTTQFYTQGTYHILGLAHTPSALYLRPNPGLDHTTNPNHSTIGVIMASYISGIPAIADESRNRIPVSRPPKNSIAASLNTSDALSTSSPTHPIALQQQTPRTCRICFESVFPEVYKKTGQIIYGGETSEEGRLIRPCGCKGSQRYVHELCLKLYRHSNPLEASYLRCPTCKVGYKFNDSLYTSIAAHALTHAFVVSVVTCAAIFIAGYAAIPLLSITIRYRQTLDYGIQVISWYTWTRGWLDHFAQGTCLVGIFGLFFIPWDMYQMLRTNTVDSPILVFFGLVGFTGQTGLWPPILTGVSRVMYLVWCVIRIWVRRYIEEGSVRVVDLDNDGNE